MSVISIKDRTPITTRPAKGDTAMSSPETEWIASRSALEIDALKLDQEAKRKLGEDIDKIENALDELLTTTLREIKTRRPKLARAAAEAALEQHKIAIRKLGFLIHEATGNSGCLKSTAIIDVPSSGWPLTEMHDESALCRRAFSSNNLTSYRSQTRCNSSACVRSRPRSAASRSCGSYLPRAPAGSLPSSCRPCS